MTANRPDQHESDLVTPRSRAPRAPSPFEFAAGLPTSCLSPRERDDLDLIQSGGYAPLTGFMTSQAAISVRRFQQLPDGTPWPAPVVLDVDAATAASAAGAARWALTDEDGTLLAVLTVTDVWEDDGGSHLGGPIQSLGPIPRWDFPTLRQPTSELLRDLATVDGPVLCAQPRGAIDTRTAARWSRAAAGLGGRLLVYPAVGADSEWAHVPRIRAYREALDLLPRETLLRLLPSGRPPDEADAAALHAVAARNAGATHLLLDAAVLRPDDVSRLGLVPVDPADFAQSTEPAARHFTQAVARELRLADPPRSKRGFVVLLTGLSGSGKSTVARTLRARLAEAGTRQVTLLDGDLVRRHLSSELGFSRADRDLNVRRIGYVASEIARHGGIALCAPIAPYDRTRREVREEVERTGAGFILVHIATPLEVCERRDVKGLYARARAGVLTGFTGIDDPYEVPADAEVTIDTSHSGPQDAADDILDHLTAKGWFAGD